MLEFFGKVEKIGITIVYYYPPTLQRSSVWEQLQITSVLVIRGVGSLRARGSWRERLIPNIKLQISPDPARSCQSLTIGFQGLGPSSRARGLPAGLGSELFGFQKMFEKLCGPKTTFLHYF